MDKLTFYINQQFQNKTCYEKIMLLEKRIKGQPIEKIKHSKIRIGKHPNVNIKAVRSNLKKTWRLLKNGHKRNSGVMNRLLFKTALCNAYYKKTVKKKKINGE